MSQERHARAKEIFLAVCHLDPEERRESLAAACEDDPLLGDEVASLLAFHDALPAGTSAEQEITVEPEDSGRDTDGVSVGDRIGPYRLLRVLGEGGMGTVWEAQEEEPVRRRVALKLIKRGMDTDAVVARFAVERQALALMNHPNVAHVFDAGATRDGRPYFAMELVAGLPITGYCNAHRLGLEDRIALFRQICDGVQHAHHKGVMHRDLKPSNLLVTTIDGRAVPKIIDFGVAKATAPVPRNGTLTGLGQWVGTPAYMSPEQSGAGPADIDTRTDVYSLGVVLYELLSGELPFEMSSSGPAGWLELQRQKEDMEPHRPSSRLRTAGRAAEEAAHQRGTDRRALERQLRGDLDWIVLKALARDRERRYASPGDLADDLGRYLEHRPVEARPPSPSYRLGRFVRRNRLGVAAALAVALAVLSGIVVAGAGYTRAVRAERQAREEAERANREAATAQEVADFLVRLFEVSDPGEARGNTVTAREVLDGGAARIDAELKSQPVVAARLMDAMGRVYHSLGLYDEARQLLERALDLQHRNLGEEHLDIAKTLGYLGDVAIDQGDFATADRLGHRAVEMRERLLGPDHPMVARSLNSLANVHWRRGEYVEAQELSNRSLRILEAALGPDDADVATTLNSLGAQSYSLGKFDEAREYWERALGIRERILGADHPLVASSLTNLALLIQEQGDIEEAIPLARRAVAVLEQTAGSEHPNLAAALTNLANIEAAAGDVTAARGHFERAIEIRKRAVGGDDTYLARSMANLGNLLIDIDPMAAKGYLERALDIRLRILGPDHTDTGWSYFLLAKYHCALDQADEAELLFRRAIDLFEALNAQHAVLVPFLLEYAECLRRFERPREAEALETRAAVLQRESGGS